MECEGCFYFKSSLQLGAGLIDNKQVLLIRLVIMKMCLVTPNGLAYDVDCINWSDWFVLWYFQICTGLTWLAEPVKPKKMVVSKIHQP